MRGFWPGGGHISPIENVFYPGGSPSSLFFMIFVSSGTGVETEHSKYPQNAQWLFIGWTNGYTDQAARYGGCALQSDRPGFQFCLCNLLGYCVTLDEFLKLSDSQLSQVFKNRRHPQKNGKNDPTSQSSGLKRGVPLQKLLIDGSKMFVSSLALGFSSLVEIFENIQRRS